MIGRLRSASLGLLLALCFLWGVAASAQRPAPAVQVKEVHSFGFTVSNLERSVEFFREALTFQKVSEVELSGSEYEHLQGLFGIRMRVARMQLGDERIELVEYLTPVGRPIPADSRSNDLWFQHMAIVVRDMEKAYRHLRRFRVRHVSPEPQILPEWNVPAAGIKAFKFRDPDGHNLELLYLPPGKGASRWHRPTDRLFLGIDHSAISISSTEKSLEFHRDLLGMKVVGGSLNYGSTQERLDNLFGARVRVTALAPPIPTPGLETLEYLTPPGARPMPRDVKSNDIVHWQVTLVVDDLNAAAEALRTRGVRFVSSRVAAFPEGRLGFKKAVMLKDPDGHAIRLVEK